MDSYITTFIAFAQTSNPRMPLDGARRHAVVFWGVTRGNWPMARRLALKGSQECHYRLVAYLPAGTNTTGIPRTDVLGMHYNFMALQAYRHGFLPRWRNWRTSKDWKRLKAAMVRDPSLGSWLAAEAWADMVRKLGSMERADRAWAEDPGYSKALDRAGVTFDRLESAEARKTANQRRTR